MSDPPPHVDSGELLHRALDKNWIRMGRVHYMAFFSSTDPHRMSVDRAAYRDLDVSIEAWGSHKGAASLEACRVRDLPVDVALDVVACPENGNNAHAEIRADPDTAKKRMKNKVCKALADISTVVRVPPGFVE